MNSAPSGLLSGTVLPNSCVTDRSLRQLVQFTANQQGFSRCITRILSLLSNRGTCSIFQEQCGW
jgi:hypothetical protein